jgi:hypothetical protein
LACCSREAAGGWRRSAFLAGRPVLPFPRAPSSYGPAPLPPRLLPAAFSLLLQQRRRRGSPRRPPWHNGAGPGPPPPSPLARCTSHGGPLTRFLCLQMTVRERTRREELSAAQVRHRRGKDDEMVVAFPELLLPAIYATTSPSCSRRSRPVPAGHHSVQLQPVTSPTYCSW